MYDTDLMAAGEALGAATYELGETDEAFEGLVGVIGNEPSEEVEAALEEVRDQLMAVHDRLATTEDALPKTSDSLRQPLADLVQFRRIEGIQQPALEPFDMERLGADVVCQYVRQLLGIVDKVTVEE